MFCAWFRSGLKASDWRLLKGSESYTRDGAELEAKTFAPQDAEVVILPVGLAPVGDPPPGKKDWRRSLEPNDDLPDAA